MRDQPEFGSHHLDQHVIFIAVYWMRTRVANSALVGTLCTMHGVVDIQAYGTLHSLLKLLGQSSPDDRAWRLIMV